MSPVRSPWRPISAGVAAVGLAVVLCPTASALAAPAPCERAEHYAAEAGAELFRLNRLDLRSAGAAGAPVTDIGLAQTRSAMVAESEISSAAAGRILDGQPAGADAGTARRAGTTELSRPVQQQAPPTNAAANRRTTRARDVGPMSVGAGTVSSLARWDPSMGCGASTGEVTRAEATLTDAAVLTGRTDEALVRVPATVRAVSTTALERRGPDVRAVSRATVTAAALDVVDHAVRVTVVRPPTLAASMSTNGGGEVRYVPAVLQVSGGSIGTRRLADAGDEVTIELTGRPGTTERPGTTARAAGTSAGPLAALLAPVPVGAAVHQVTAAAPLDLPGLPSRGMPELRAPGSGPDGESAAAGVHPALRISVGEVRQATAGHAIAARAAAVHLRLTAGSSAAQPSTTPGADTLLDLDLGILEAAAVSPEPAGAGGADPRAGGAAGGLGGLPVTGPRADPMAAGGLALLVLGVGFLAFGLVPRGWRR